MAERPAETLGLAALEGWRLWLGLALPLGYGVVALGQLRAMRASPRSLAAARGQLEPVRALVPVTRGDWQAFAPLAVTAGVCEELLFRGYVVWCSRRGSASGAPRA